MNLAHTIAGILIESGELRRLAGVGLPMLEANRIIMDALSQFGKVSVLKQYNKLTNTAKKGRHYNVNITVNERLLQELSHELNVPEWHWYVRRRVEHLIVDALYATKIPGMYVKMSNSDVDYFPSTKIAMASFTVLPYHHRSQ